MHILFPEKIHADRIYLDIQRTKRLVPNVIIKLIDTKAAVGRQQLGSQTENNTTMNQPQIYHETWLTNK